MRASTRLTAPAFLIGSYFGCLALLLAGVRRWLPGLEPYLPFGGIEALSSARLEPLQAERFTRAQSQGEIVETVWDSAPSGNFDALTLALAIAGAVAVMLPISWVYFITTRSKDVNRSFAQTMIVLPVIVAGIATVVQNSLALAFSLAGIVAAVRFRFTLSEPAHALYIFVAIAVGLAAGIGALGIAYVTSVAFVIVNLLLWRLEYGADLTGPFFAFLTGRGRDDNQL